MFGLYVPEEFTTLGWELVFLFSILVVGYWGTVDEEAVEELQDRLDEIEAEQSEESAA